VDRQYDLFEVTPDRSPLWREAVTGHENAIQRLRELSARTTNEVRILHLPTNTVIAAMNAPPDALGDFWVQDGKSSDARPSKAPDKLS
jgi:hypothetical protein